MLFNIVLDEVQFEYITGLIQEDINFDKGFPGNDYEKTIQIKEKILEDLRYYYRHRKVKED